MGTVGRARSRYYITLRPVELSWYYLKLIVNSHYATEGRCQHD